MSSNFNNAKIINVYYNKGDRKPYDVNGKPIAYIGEEFVGANQATEIRFHFGEELDSASAIIVAKRANNDTRLDPLILVPNSGNPYYKIELNAWYAEYKGKMTIIFKVYNGTVTYDDPVTPTQIVSTTGQIIVSDIFNLEVAYAPNASSLVPPFQTEDYDDWFFTLSTKLDKAQSITVAGALPDPLTGYDDRYFYIENEGVGRLYYINGSTPIEVVWQVGTLRLTPTGNGNITDDTGKLSWQQTNGTAQLGLYNYVKIGIGEDVFYYGKASATINKGQAIQFGGYDGDHILIKPAVPSEINANPKYIMGIAKQNISNGDFGYVAHFGKLDGFDSGSFAEGSLLWFDSGSASNGLLTATQPTAPNAKILMCGVIKAETNPAANNGVIQVRINIEPKLEELQNVLITSATNGNVLSYDGTKWVNSTRLTTAETDIANIEDGTTIVGKALGDQNGNTIDTTYLTIASGSSTYVPLSSKGVANGVAPLGADNKIPSIHLPGGVDDIKEFANLASFPVVGEASIIYVALDTNKIYRWSGSAYVEISSSLALGTTSSTAFPGDRGLATETKTDNIVDGTQTLSDTKITNSAVGVVPLQINSLASTSTSLQEWFVGDSRVAFINQTGRLLTTAVTSRTSANNSAIFFNDTGTLISRNINDVTNINPALTINQNQGLGDILRLQSAGANVLEITRTGGLNQNGTRLFDTNGTGNTHIGLTSGGATIKGEYNIAVGQNALSGINNAAATSNIMVGWNAGSAITSGNTNVGVGHRAGGSINTGFGNTFVGHNAGNNVSQIGTLQNTTAIGNGSYTDTNNQMVFGNASVTQFKFDRNASAVLLAPNLTASSSTAHEITRTSSDTNTALVSLALKHKTSGDMIDGFSSRIFFTIEDNANVNNFISGIGGARSGADNSGRLTFLTNNAGSLTEKMTILPDGKVGIGTASPTTLLDVADTSSTTFTVRNTGTISSILLSNGSATNQIFSRGINSSTGRPLAFVQGTAEAMRITSDGLVGINETSPSAQLQVKSGATNRIPLFIDTVANHAEALQVLKVNGVTRAIFDVNGELTNTGFYNLSSPNNSRIQMLTTGTTISRNVNDTNPALIVNLANASSGGYIQVWQKSGVAQAYIRNNGSAVLSGIDIEKSGIVIDTDTFTVPSTKPIYIWDAENAIEHFYIEPDGDVYNANGTYGTISDVRVKENIIDARNYTEDLMKLRVVKYSLKKDKETEPTHLGFIAQEFEQVFPKMVATSEHGDIKDFKAIKTSVLIPMLVKAIQEQQKQINELMKKIG
jgi:hypothetical protein